MEKNELIRLYDKQAKQYDKIRRKKIPSDRKWRRRLLEAAADSGIKAKFITSAVEDF
jgi:hypothetical protein